MNFPAPISQIHIARNGELLGQVASDKIADSLEEGGLLSTDFFYDEKKAEWLPLTEWVQPVKAKPATREPAPGPAPRPMEGGASPERTRRRPKKPTASKQGCAVSFLGWIACLFCAGAAATLWVFNQSLNDQLTTAQKNLEGSKQSIAAVRKESEALAELTPPGQVRCLAVRQSGDEVSVLSGVTVGLYARADVERAIAAQNSADPLAGNANFSDAVEKVKGALKTPVSLSLSDADGEVTLTAPTSGDFVLVADANPRVTGASDQYFWLVGIKGTAQPSAVILLNAQDAVTKDRSQFVIKDIRPFSAPSP